MPPIRIGVAAGAAGAAGAAEGVAVVADPPAASPEDMRKAGALDAAAGVLDGTDATGVDPTRELSSTELGIDGALAV